VNSDNQLRRNQYADSRHLSARVNIHVRYSTNPQGWERWLFQQLGLRENSTVLDVGSGPGRLWRSHVVAIPAGCRLVLTDASERMVAEARSTLGDRRFAFAVVDAQAIPFPDHRFDLVTAHHMLYHVSDLSRALSEIARVLKPNGTLSAATNGVAHMRELNEIIRRSIPDFEMPTGSFTLENGADALKHHFEGISERRYEDRLVVPDASALTGYVRSMAGLTEVSEVHLAEIDEAIRERIRSRGSLQIEKAAGVFIARRRASPS